MRWLAAVGVGVGVVAACVATVFAQGAWHVDLSGVVQVLSTAGLLWVTWLYVKTTRQMARHMEVQATAAAQQAETLQAQDERRALMRAWSLAFHISREMRYFERAFSKFKDANDAEPLGLDDLPELDAHKLARARELVENYTVALMELIPSLPFGFNVTPILLESRVRDALKEFSEVLACAGDVGAACQVADQTPTVGDLRRAWGVQYELKPTNRKRWEDIVAGARAERVRGGAQDVMNQAYHLLYPLPRERAV